MLYLVSIGAIAVGTLALLLGRQLYYKTNLDTLSDVLKGCGAIIIVLSIVVTIILTIYLVGNNDNPAGRRAELEQERDALVYQVEHHMYDNDNDIGKKELADEVKRWNMRLANYRIKQHNKWIGIFYPDIIDGLKLIPFELFDE